MPAVYNILDLFAGPGGLGEGFSACRRSDGSTPFRIRLSVEMDKAAHSTLRLRSFLRKFPRPPAEYYKLIGSRNFAEALAEQYPDEWREAERETLCVELGTEKGDREVSRAIKQDAHLSDRNRTIIIGGPPCQAYSLVGRARNKGKNGYIPEEDGRHYLFREYVALLKRLRPAAFVMENVKGILSSSVEGDFIFKSIVRDLSSAGGAKGSYTLLALSPQQDLFGLDQGTAGRSTFIVRAENYGIPQARHRVIIVGVRSDLVSGLSPTEIERLAALIPSKQPAHVRHVLDGLPALRSGLSDREDSLEHWRSIAAAQCDLAMRACDKRKDETLKRTAEILSRIKAGLAKSSLQRKSSEGASVADDCPADLRRWFVDAKLPSAPNHETRGHMESDLGRYIFCAAFAKANDRSPKASEFPARLAPAHQNWRSGKFADRFRVQIADAPGTTVTSHISKDGHYFIHPDPLQCRALTVREAARLQTFPDNYLFQGNRTQQYVQVGNAVPPMLARQIAESLLGILDRSSAKSASSHALTRVA